MVPWRHVLRDAHIAERSDLRDAEPPQIEAMGRVVDRSQRGKGGRGMGRDGGRKPAGMEEQGGMLILDEHLRQSAWVGVPAAQRFYAMLGCPA
ncbi:hypothetical protein GOP47_0012159 [Adiantum capillus-veneris]|uniref:Uncharacterized protein n=1 Tax=Adiantum capillus-veneris TaxID=13818 RepID=A0A9D4ZE19_ADICA|nr:hypothetical protein GOP47_0012159 [Adiantum capillus-veneris]